MTVKMSNLKRIRPFIFGTLFFCLTSGLFAQTVANIQDAQGRIYSYSELKQHTATVFIFLATDCPNSNSYAPEMARLNQEYGSRGVAFYGVYSDPAETPAGVRKHDVDYGIRFPSLMDSAQILARETGALGTPESVILSPSGKVLYRGRIDDRYAAYGKTRLHVDQHDLRDALDEVLARKPVGHPYEPALGCAIPGIIK